MIEAKAGALAYVPTRIAIGFRYRGWSFRSGTLAITFRDRASRLLRFTAARRAGDCAAGKQTSFQLDGNKVYWSPTPAGQKAWRCVTGANGRQIELAVDTPMPPTAFAASGLGIVAASGKRIA